MEDNTRQKVLETFNEVKNTHFTDLKDAVEEYGAAYVFDVWLRYIGIVGYTREILAVLSTLGMLDYEEKW